MKNKISPEPFQWKDEYNVDISIIDEQHKKFLEIINQSLSARMNVKTLFPIFFINWPISLITTLFRKKSILRIASIPISININQTIMNSLTGL